MTTAKTRTWPLAQATEVAEELITLLRPACERIEVAGSIRRKKKLVGDVELLVIPKGTIQSPLWLEREALDRGVLELITRGLVALRLNKKGASTFGPLNKLLVHVPSGIGVDLFSTTAENFGMAWVVRTGPKEFNIKMMSRFKELGCQGHAYAGITNQDGKETDCPDEETVFRLLGWRFRAPEERG